MMFENTEVEIELKTGKGEITYFKKTPVISHLMKLHKKHIKLVDLLLRYFWLVFNHYCFNRCHDGHCW